MKLQQAGAKTLVSMETLGDAHGHGAKDVDHVKRLFIFICWFVQAEK